VALLLLGYGLLQLGRHMGRNERLVEVVGFETYLAQGAALRASLDSMKRVADSTLQELAQMHAKPPRMPLAARSPISRPFSRPKPDTAPRAVVPRP
jgi:hypothetical protein